MGVIAVTFQGSFREIVKSTSRVQFSALSHGHVDAVEQAVEYLTHTVLPAAKTRDMGLASVGHHPEHGFGATILNALTAKL